MIIWLSSLRTTCLTEIDYICLRNRKHVTYLVYFYQVIKKHESKSRRTRNAVGTPADGQMFPKLFQVLLNFHCCFYNSKETQQTCFLFLLENTAKKKGKWLVYFDHQNEYSICLCYHHVNSLWYSVFLLSYRNTFLTNQCAYFLRDVL